ncbi:MAG: hypothetical protein D6729_12930 [Deltaproteobacteria bacterium]|nr:MAG: hypothetical protein D6729_12930 [Deltaproteobacteria bacterium]
MRLKPRVRRALEAALERRTEAAASAHGEARRTLARRIEALHHSERALGAARDRRYEALGSPGAGWAREALYRRLETEVAAAAEAKRQAAAASEAARRHCEAARRALVDTLVRGRLLRRRLDSP